MDFGTILAHVIDLDYLVWVAGSAVTVVGAAGLIVRPVRRTLKRYDSALDSYGKALKDYKDMFEAQAQSLEDSKIDRQRLHAELEAIKADDLSPIKKALLIQSKVEINKICDKAIDRGYIFSRELEGAEMLFETYEPLGGNGVTRTKMEAARKLKIRSQTRNKIVEDNKE